MLRRLKKYFFSGLAVFLPLILTIYISIWALNFAESLFGKYLRVFFIEHYDFYFWGFGIIVLLLVIFACGFLITNYFGRVAHRMAENLLLNVPLIKNIYPAFKEIAQFLFREEGAASNPQQVVMVEWPRKGVWSIGFMTNVSPAEVKAKSGRDLVNVLIPTVPNPLTGFVLMFPREEVTILAMTIEEAVKIIVSGGVVIPGIPESNEKAPS